MASETALGKERGPAGSVGLLQRERLVKPVRDAPAETRDYYRAVTYLGDRFDTLFDTLDLDDPRVTHCQGLEGPETEATVVNFFEAETGKQAHGPRMRVSRSEIGDDVHYSMTFDVATDSPFAHLEDQSRSRPRYTHYIHWSVSKDGGRYRRVSHNVSELLPASLAEKRARETQWRLADKAEVDTLGHFNESTHLIDPDTEAILRTRHGFEIIPKGPVVRLLGLLARVSPEHRERIVEYHPGGPVPD